MEKFNNRKEAGQQLATALQNHKEQPNTIILTLPRGGVAVAHEVALALHLPMTVFLVRKIGVPSDPKLCVGAIGEKNICLTNNLLITQLKINDAQLQEVLNKEKEEITRQMKLYRKGNELPEITHKTIILIDDGIATGSTMKAAINTLSQLKPNRIVLATPVASKISLKELSPLVDEYVFLINPEPFYTVSRWYQHFDQVTDKKVIKLLDEIKNVA